MSATASETRLQVPRQRGLVTALAPAAAQPSPRTAFAIPAITVAVDVVVVCVAIAVALLGRNLLPVPVQGTGLVPLLSLAVPVLVVGWPLTIWLHGGYKEAVLGAGPDEYMRVLRSSVAIAAVVGVGCYFAQLELSRSFLLLDLLVGSSLLLVGRRATRAAVRRARANGALTQRVLIVGSESHVNEVGRVLAREKTLGYQPIGALTETHRERSQTAAGVPVLGPASSVVEVARELQPDVVFLAGGAVDSAAELRAIAWELESSHTQVVVAPSVTDVCRERVSVRPTGGLPLLHLEKPRHAQALRRAKRTFDVVGSALLMLALAPLYLLAALQIWSHDRGPILFRQERIGRDGVAFKCFKFRTMVQDAEALLAQLHAAEGIDPGIFHKVKADPRITRPGRWLRRFSVDELPQLLNVLRGEMSLVGPRPQVAHEVALYDNAMARRLHVKPGMTGLWQVSGRSDLSVEEAVRLDLYYVDNWSMFQDLTILFRTFGAVLGSRGAY